MTNRKQNKTANGVLHHIYTVLIKAFFIVRISYAFTIEA